MFRKRKVVAPFFKMPNPTNPITGSHEYLYPPLKPYARFKLTEAMTTTDEVKKAEITDPGQWGPNPIYHDSHTIIHVHNQLADDDTTYIFSGAIGDVGIALHDYMNHWRIIMLGAAGGGGNSVATTETIIPARSGNVPGGPIEVIKKKIVDITASPLAFESAGTVNVYSWVQSPSSDPGNGVLWIFIEQDEYGVWWFTGEDCP